MQGFLPIPAPAHGIGFPKIKCFTLFLVRMPYRPVTRIVSRKYHAFCRLSAQQIAFRPRFVSHEHGLGRSFRRAAGLG
jgi:hypothetical protein